MKTRLLLSFLLLAVMVSAQTYTESVLYNFPDSGFLFPTTLVMDSAGNLYGTTTYGPIADDFGTIFELTTGGVFSTLYTFAGGTDGAYPCCLVINKSGDLYGTTYQGGVGYGTVFKFATTKKKFSTLHEFGRTSATDGLDPTGPLTMDSAGNLYGMTSAGGKNVDCMNGSGSEAGCGTIFEVTSKGSESTLHNFTSSLGPPFGNVLRTSKGSFYGVGGGGYLPVTANVLFEVTSSGVESVLNDDLGLGQSGYNVYSGYVSRSAAGNFYGGFGYQVTCGSSSCNYSGLWEVVGSDDVLSEYYFTYDCSAGCTNMVDPDGPLLLSGGNIYGTAEFGGSANVGAVFEFNESSATETVLYNFTGLFNNPSPDGSTPGSGVIADSEGSLYGTTYSGGTYGYGTVFKLTKNN
jgi:uncharacterized repeat protein (TIGR03803 family)